MKEISLEEQKKLQLDMLIDFANFCDKNNITYYLSGGTLLGAIRHKGFIPWDDDIDIMMPRDDYERAINLYKNDVYVLDAIENNPLCWERYARIYNKKTIIFSNVRNKYKEHIFIDIFPIDGLSNNKLSQKYVFFMQKILTTAHLASVLDFSLSNRYADKNAGFYNWKIYVRTFIKYLLILTVGNIKPQVWIKLMTILAKKRNFYKSDWVAVLIAASYGSKEIMPKNIFRSKIQVDFESHKFWAPVGYDYYLKSLYGDYMKLPPIEKRQSHHDFKAYWKE